MQRYKIMIVDDEEEVRTSMIKKMPWEELGFRVVGDAENGEDALEKISLLEPDVLFTDIRMPYVDGLELAERVKRERESIEIIFFSGFNEFEYAKQAIKLNAIEYVLKPVNVEELKVILQRVKRSMDKKIEERRDVQMLRDNYQKALPVLREYFLNGVAHGELGKEEILDGLRRYGLYEEAAVKRGIISVDIRVLPEEAREEAFLFHEEKELLPMSVWKLIDERMKDKYTYSVFLSGNMERMHIVYGVGTEGEGSDLIHIMNQVSYDCRRILGLDITVGIGKAYSEVTQISTSYEESMDAMGYRALLNTNLPIYIEDVEAVKEETLSFDEKTEGQLAQVIKFGSGEDIERMVDRLVDRMEHAKVHSSQHQIYLIAVFNSLTKLIQKYELNTIDIWGGEKTYYAVLSRLMTAHSVKNFLFNTCISIHENINREREDTIVSIISEAKDYIENHYSDPGLSVEMVCSHLHISCAYFSTMFKKETGKNYVSWLTEIRMKKAAELLLKTDDKTYLIAAKVGYLEPNYFSHVFKRKYGISPSKYRISVREENEETEIAI